MNVEDQKLVERVQRRATKLLPEIRNLSYEDRLRKLRLPSLKYRRRRGDMILMYHLVHGHLGIRKEDYLLDPTVTTTRGHSLKIGKPQAATRARRNHLTVRAVNDWNGLPEQVANANSTNEFKNGLDEHWREYVYDAPT